MRGMIESSFQEPQPSGGDKVVQRESFCVGSDSELCEGPMHFWSGKDHLQASVVSVVDGSPIHR